MAKIKQGYNTKMDDQGNPQEPNPDLAPIDETRKAQDEAWLRLRGAMKDVFAELGGGEAYMIQERAEFNRAMEAREQEIERIRRESRGSS